MLPRIAFVALLLLPASRAGAADLEREFAQSVRPFLETYCVSCHGKDKPKGQLDLSAFTSVPAVVRSIRKADSVLEMLVTRDMPPEKAKHPGDEARAGVVKWIEALRQREAERFAGDPGPVLARRLSNAEYDYTIRDLTGADIRPTREFPVDPANEAGFDNSGESLAMSPALLKKYLEAARGVAEHLVLQPNGIAFAPDPAVTDTDRDKYAIMRVVGFYARQPTDLAGYFRAAWRYKHRDEMGKPDATIAEWAAAEKVSPKYLATVWAALQAREEIGPLARLQGLWNALPEGEDEKELWEACEKLRDYVLGLREKVAPKFKNLQLKAVAAGSQPFILWKNTQLATHRTSFNKDALVVRGTSPPRVVIAARSETLQSAFFLAMAVNAYANRNFMTDSLPIPFAAAELADKFAPPDPDLVIPDESSRARYDAAFTRFCQVFPDAFYVQERGRMHLDRPKERRDRGRLLTAGFHNSFGYFRDDQPLYQMILDEKGQRELDGLWRELDLVTHAPTRQWADFIFYERAESHTIKGPEFDFIRSEDKASSSAANVRRMAKVYVAKAEESLRTDGGDEIAIPVLEEFFQTFSTNLRRVERDQVAAEPSHLQGLLAVAERAYRRPLTGAERRSLLAFYKSLRKSDGLDHDAAMRDTLASVLVSPHFLYRVDLVAGRGARRLPEHALASRLSYFLWSSMPDQELLAHAAAGDLHRPEVLTAQVRRMVQDERARALAVEFGGQWLDFRRFEELNTVDRERFPSFDNQLRQAMFEEPVRFFADVMRSDRSVLDFVYGRHTFVNGVLAKHYGMPAPPDKAGWVRVDGADRYQRGGILPMAVFLTKNAPGLRTSPVKRGYWVVRRALGEHIPAPPAQVPDLPNDERKMGNLTLREVLARHREEKSCAACHARFDSFGLAFEGYGPVGELRKVDLAGRPVDTRAVFPGDGAGVEGTGLEGLRQYVRDHRQDDFLDNLCRKLLAYALGRGLILSDEPALRQIRARLAQSDFHFGALVESIVTTPQFLTKRGRDELAQRVD